jgi:hypothetical protein
MANAMLAAEHFLFQRSVTPWRGTNRLLGTKPTPTVSVIWTCQMQPCPFHGSLVGHLPRFLKKCPGRDEVCRAHAERAYFGPSLDVRRPFILTGFPARNW